MNKEDYEKDLKKRQEQHLKNIQGFRESTWQPCLHDSCSSCLGTGVKENGSICIHFISCSCPKCSPQCLASNAMHTQTISNAYNDLKNKVEIPFRHKKVLDWDKVESVWDKYFKG